MIEIETMRVLPNFEARNKELERRN